MANACRAINNIDVLEVEGVRMKEEEIKRYVEEHFKKLYLENSVIRPKVDGLEFLQLEEGQTAWLERAFEEEEVRKAVWSLDGDKAPGPDGFSLAFYKAY